MEVGLPTLALAAFAGILTVANPCVLPLLPLVAAAAVARSLSGLVALAAGLGVAFAGAGTVLASSGRMLDGDWMRQGAAVLVLAVGAWLVSERMQAAFAHATAGVADGANRVMTRMEPAGVPGQFGIGMLLGLVWSPCVGPTLGVAVLLAAQGEQLVDVAVVMAVFSVAAVTPLLLAGLASRAAFIRHSDRAVAFGAKSRHVLGWALLAIGVLVLTGGDKWLETRLLDHAPDWLIELTTRY